VTDEQPSILVIDDTPGNLSLLNQLLREHYRVRLANSGPRGLELAAMAPPDLILLDIMMPDMDGYQVFQRLQSDPATRRIPVIFLTAKVGAEDEERGLAMGAVDFIHKPIARRWCSPGCAPICRSATGRPFSRTRAPGCSRRSSPGERGFPVAGGDDPGHGLPGRIPR
jgi:CheY-like chemotaxis protein